MKLIQPSTEILTPLDGKEILKVLEKVARTCYKSEDKISENSAEKLISLLVKKGHEAMLEFFDVTVKFVCDRGVSHEIVRHRLGSYAQESTRYCNYSDDKFDNQITFIIPNWLYLEPGSYTMLEDNGVFDTPTGIVPFHEMSVENLLFLSAIQETEVRYNELISVGWQAQQARSVLPNALKTEINVKYNLREWRHFFKMRCAQAAHPQMRELTLPLLKEFHNQIPIVFDDLYNEFFLKITEKELKSI